MDTPNGWTTSPDGKALEKSFRFRDFSEAFAFLTRVAMHAEKVDHHPEFTNVWNRVDFRLTTHDAGGITNRDRELATEIEELAAQSS
ncbi:MAG TPA: 4a-hydroxytetrahydrobiopterin dehydratase [Sphingomicrobium sp.]|jgi:4a-hydroxytetrahydrobiopterin dehydratase|nr:4a-hydroxytetrahydrobiopterin dehydratase [Sphingomicrobium sp.]